MFSISATRIRAVLLSVSLCLGLIGLWSAPAQAQVTAFKQAVAEAAARDRDLAAFYRDNGYQPVWTGSSAADRERRAALFGAIEIADSHGLPVARYDAEGLMARLKSVRSPREAGLAEVEMSRTFLRLAREMQTGALIPGQVDGDIKRQVDYRDRISYLTSLIESSPRAYFRALPPRSNEYARLMKEKMRLESLAQTGGWGPKVPGAALKPGQSGTAVVALRNRLTAMGFLGRSATQTYDESILLAVQRFQEAHGLTPDGVAGASTMTEVNATVTDRLKSVIVAMERERWLNQPLGERHILVNLTDFQARIVDHGSVTFETRVVVGKNTGDRRSPEFSDVMDHMVINPTWHVPRSIAVNEYLPQMQRNRNAVSHLRLYNSRGQQVSRGAVNFNAYNARTFPFAIKQPPSQRNALGLVKFMFPNKYNIYLHDTPAKDLFEREKRDYSHGCIRVQKPFELAYELLAPQEADPKGKFHSVLDAGREKRVDLEREVPVHIIYRTAFTSAKGHMQYRRDVYGRDAKIWDALGKAGVSLHAVQG
ncbi:MAG: L,D-transpeptidase family protein [Pseudomonadota bacterium]|uniref:L,D-transpeptidase family protein n=1 Tax=Roseovarius TaxID=74030 RepID=UPI0022A72D66|nr:L,D-transpeptidase family protein [Roseovarius sp. EGI FJ00037]MCZ0811045.1 L,D-transpeptidase family protein [Roseovarius sp. EGI FJ00037]